MKKLFVLVVVILLTGLLAGCWVLPESKLISIGVEPGGMYLSPGETRVIDSVTACYEDGTTKELKLTDCEYCTYNCEVATVDGEGLITAKSIGEAVILVSYTEQNFWTGKITETDVVCVQVVLED